MRFARKIMEANSMEVKGLTTEEVLKRSADGKNVLTQGRKKSLFSIILEQFASPLVLKLPRMPQK